jgi:hypothetical protein
MTDKTTDDAVPGGKYGVVQQPNYPDGSRGPTKAGPKRAQKQAGQDLRDPQNGASDGE